MTLSQDAFTRADGGLGANYDLLGGLAPRIVSNRVLPNASVTGGEESLVLYATLCGSADMYTQVDGKWVSDYGNFALIARGTDINNGYFCSINQEDKRAELVQMNGGSHALLRSGTNNELTWAVGTTVTFKLEVTGTGATVTIVLKANGTTVFTYNDSSANRVTSGQRGGFGFGYVPNGTCFEADNYEQDLIGGGDTTPPVISSIVATPAVTASTITWTTDEASDSQVEYGLTNAYGSSTTLDTNDVTSHSVTVTGLTASTLYHYRVKSRDPANNLQTSADGTFTTAATQSSSTTRSVTVLPLAGNAPVANFTVSSNPATQGAALTFTDTSTNTPTSWAWTFDDGTTSVLQNPIKTFNVPGTYNVRLTATNAYGSSQKTTAVVINATGAGNKILKAQINAATATSPYISVKVLVGIINTPDANLLVKLKRNSDNVQFGTDKTITVADLGTAVFVKDGYTFYLLQFNMPSGQTLASATTYYLEFSSTATIAAPWYLAMLDQTEENTLTGDITYGGSTVTAVVEGVAQSGDFVVTLASVPTAPTGLSAVVSYDALPDMGDTNCCDGCERGFVTLDWTSTALGASFSYYEVQRSSDGGTTWFTIGKEDTEASSGFEDDEALRGVLESYRVRVVRVDGVPSAWSSTATATVPVGVGDLVYLTSNQNRTLSTGFIRIGEEHKITFLSAADVKHMKVHDRDYQLSIRPLENRGVSFPLSMLISNGPSEPAYGAGVQAWDTVRAICEAPISYVCVLTADGERFFGDVLLPEGIRKEPAKMYIANAMFIQTTATPTTEVY